MPINPTISSPTKTRRYVTIAKELRDQLSQNSYKVGARLPTEREIAEFYSVSRTIIREAIIMLEIEGLVEVRKGSGVYVVNLPLKDSAFMSHQFEKNTFTSAFSSLTGTDIGPFERLQAHQLIESNIAEFAAHQITKSEINAMKKVLAKERQALEAGESKKEYDLAFHILIAEATKNTFLVDLVKLMWRIRDESLMWAQLQAHIDTTDYRKIWLNDHAEILSSLQKKDASGAKKSMQRHLENVKITLLELSDVDHDNFDGYLFDSYPLLKK